MGFFHVPVYVDVVQLSPRVHDGGSERSNIYTNVRYGADLRLERDYQCRAVRRICGLVHYYPTKEVRPVKGNRRVKYRNAPSKLR